ncbi:hypothetical protein H6P81_000712 [Aristolochia fimbriata]|uniref:Uncharacterized protein n=1 Tax=Aristolochia fimbriata TaxID=158543 RepID=A0AAV7F6H7_ARIFI|nr:hypothetical protein H6P81_000712 [Aristolochia fimbriata]
MPAIPMSSTLSFDEDRWVIQIRRSLEEEDIEDEEEEDNEVAVSIFDVPKTLMANKPEAYVPQQVAIGPYHHWRPELYDMEQYKLSAAKKVQRRFSLKFHHLIDHLLMLEPRIRRCYHRYLDFNGETLCWGVAVDACFLLEFLRIFGLREDKEVAGSVCSRMSHLIDDAGTKSAHNAILRDVMMLENQIPLFLLRTIMKFQKSSSSSQKHSDHLLRSMLVGFCKAISPFKIAGDLESINVTRHAHLLELVFFVIMPKSDETTEIEEAEEEEEDSSTEAKETSHGIITLSATGESPIKKLLNKIWNPICRAVHLMKNLIFSKPVKFALRNLWRIISLLPVVSLVKQPVEYLCFSVGDENRVDKEESSNDNRPPLIEEITIPSVTELAFAGVKFAPTNGDLSTISFSKKTATLYLPTITLDVNAEVVLRNMVAYEASAASGPLVLTRYTELMNGIIDTGEDAKLLRERGVLINRLQTDEEVGDMWNGMTKSVRLTKVPFLDKVIEDVNRLPALCITAEESGARRR